MAGKQGGYRRTGGQNGVVDMMAGKQGGHRRTDR
jgi:hypothetical protein